MGSRSCSSQARKNAKRIEIKWRKKNKGGMGFLPRMGKTNPHHDNTHENIVNGIEGLFGRAFEDCGMGIGEVLWKDTFKLENNDKVNDLVYNLK